MADWTLMPQLHRDPSPKIIIRRVIGCQHNGYLLAKEIAESLRVEKYMDWH
jgi:hypothetical protein